MHSRNSLLIIIDIIQTLLNCMGHQPDTLYWNSRHVHSLSKCLLLRELIVIDHIYIYIYI